MLHEERQVGFNEETAKFYAADIVNALQYMYEMKIVHRDLKPENMVVCKKDGHLRIVDFGTAKNLADTSLNGPNFVGTPEYMSPETIDNKSVSYTADYWAFGCILYQFLTGETPFAGGSMYLTFLKAQEATNYTFPSFLSEEAKDLIQKLLQKDPTKRPTIEEIKAHPFFDGIDFKNHMSKPRPLVLSHDPKYFSLVKEFAATNSTSTLSTSSTTPTSPSCSVVSSQTSTGIHHFQDGLQDRIMNFASASEKHLLMHLLKRKQILHLETVYPRFFRTPGLGRCRYATNRSYVGLTHDLQNEWNQSFEVVQITGPSIGSENGLKIFEETIEIINQRNPLPYVVVINGNFIQASPEEENEERYQSQADTFHTLVARFDPSIRLVSYFLPYFTVVQ
jgi:3-phosphoinositide dependent protein kinase-1